LEEKLHYFKNLVFPCFFNVLKYSQIKFLAKINLYFINPNYLGGYNYKNDKNDTYTLFFLWLFAKKIYFCEN
jgi:hypothetical protein